MFEWLNKTYEQFPKQAGETERTLSVTSYTDEIHLRLTVYINDLRHDYKHALSNLEYEALKKTDIGEVLLRRICRKFNDQFNATTSI